MNNLIAHRRDANNILADHAKLTKFQQDLRGMLLKVLKGTRRIIDDPLYFHKAYYWNQVCFLLLFLLSFVRNNMNEKINSFFFKLLDSRTCLQRIKKNRNERVANAEKESNFL